jgi:N-acetylglucosamine kinase-like BadF-type ATPase
MSGQRMYLGVDGGGTKTALCLIDGDGRVRASAQAPSSYYFTEGIGLVGRVLRQGIDAVCEQAGITPQDIDYAFFGLPSYGESSREVPDLDAAPGEVLGHDRYAVDNDMVCGWAGSLGAQDGINVICGTGSMTYGEHAGRRARVGGWGELFGDEGSAYWIAIRGLAAFTRMSDGRLPAGPLLEVLRAHLDLSGDLDLIDVVLGRWQGGRTEIAALSPLVVEAADRGDEHAAAILDEAASELAVLVDVTRRRLEFGEGDTVPVSYSGGVFTAERVRAAFAEKLAALHGGYDLRTPIYPPVIGAALYAAKLAGTPFDDATLNRLRSTSSGTTNPGDTDVEQP